MQGTFKADVEVPVWARKHAFPVKPANVGDFGFIDAKGKVHGARDESELVEQVRHSRAGVDLAWTPQSDRLLVPEQIPALHAPVRLRFLKQAEQDISDGKRMGMVFGLMLLWILYAAWQNSGGQLAALYTNQIAGLAAMLLFFFGLLPLYEGAKTKRHLARTKTADLAQEIPEAQFEAWLHRQKIPATRFLLICLLVCGIVQVFYDKSLTRFDESIIQAGLLKQVASAHPEQADGSAWWRMLTAPMLHGNVLHFLMNAIGLLYFGRRTEILARWSHMLIVFVGAAWVGGLASFQWVPEKAAVGASGGLTGLLGFMLVFEYMHPRIVPKPARDRLLAGLVVLIVVGFLGMSFIDNAAHLGGLIAGMAYAWIVFPPSSSTSRPEPLAKDVFAGLAAAGLILCAVFTLAIKVIS